MSENYKPVGNEADNQAKVIKYFFGGMLVGAALTGYGIWHTATGDEPKASVNFSVGVGYINYTREDIPNGRRIIYKGAGPLQKVLRLFEDDPFYIECGAKNTSIAPSDGVRSIIVTINNKTVGYENSQITGLNKRIFPFYGTNDLNFGNNPIICDIVTADGESYETTALIEKVTTGPKMPNLLK